MPVTSTIIQDMISTTPVRKAVPRLDSTLVMPTLPRMAVRLANRADPRAYQSQRLSLAVTFWVSFFSSMRKVPAAMRRMPTPLVHVRDSPSSSTASRMVSTVLDLSMGTTLLMFPS